MNLIETGDIENSNQEIKSEIYGWDLDCTMRKVVQ